MPNLINFEFFKILIYELYTMKKHSPPFHGEAVPCHLGLPDKIQNAQFRVHFRRTTKAFEA